MGGGYGKVPPNVTRWREGLANMPHDIFSKISNYIFVFWLVFSKEKGYSLKIKMSRHTMGAAPVSPNDTWGRGSKIGQKSVAY
jgi:hypothetical protein